MHGAVRGFAVLAALVAAPAAAQERIAAAPETYAAEYFERFNPTSAEDMVRQVPGFTIEEGADVRGFAGAASNVLINGERPSTKEPVADLLRRIPAASVLRIELVTSASGELDMRGQTKVANVVVSRVPDAGGPVNWRLFARRYQGGRITGEIQANTVVPMLGGSLALDVAAGQARLEGPLNGTRDLGRRAYFDGAGVQFEGQTGIAHNESIIIEPSFEYERPYGWGALRVNGGWDGCCSSGTTYYQVFSPDHSGELARIEASAFDTDRSTLTLGGDIERTFSADASAKLITVNERSDVTTARVFDFLDSQGVLDRATHVDADERSGESIVRGQLNWSMGADHALEAAVEGAYNFLDSTRRVTLDTGMDATPPGSDTIVEELRGEVQLSDVWRATPRLTVEPRIAVELSRIEQEVRLPSAPSFFEERTLTYPKPSIAATWRPSERRQVRLSLERDLAQLNFADFVSSLEVVNDVVTSGNTELQPERSWSLSAAYERRLWADSVVTLSAAHDWVEGVQDLVCVVPVSADPADLTPCIERLDSFDGPGNLGDGRRWSAGLDAALALDRFGIGGGRLNVDVRSGGSAVVDPVTGETREFSNAFSRSWSTEFRQDLPRYRVSWGAQASGNDGSSIFRLREVLVRQRSGTYLGAFVETTRFFGLNIRVGYDDILETRYTSLRTVYDAPRSIGAPELIQDASAKNGPIAYLRVAGAF